MANSIIGAIEEVAKALGINFPELPTPTPEDAGKVLGIDSNGDYALITPTELPTPEVADAGKVLGVDAEGKYALITPETPDDSGTDDSGT